MRELKFRVWNTIDRKMLKWGDIFHLPAWEIFPGTPEQRAFDIMQYTGLKDKNGVEIYEGDIVLNEYYDEYGEVVYGEGGFVVKYSTWEHDLGEAYQHSEVVGNIYENPELLKDGKC